jgi:hypothetical protein
VIIVVWLTEKHFQLVPQMLKALYGDFWALPGLGKNEAPCTTACVKTTHKSVITGFGTLCRPIY